MNISHQFPPSSPLLNSDPDSEDNIINYKDDTFEHNCVASKFNVKQLTSQKDNVYATPDPSSSLGNTTIISEANNDDSDISIINCPIKEVTTIEPELSDNQSCKELKTKLTSCSLSNNKSILNKSNFKNIINVPLNGDTFKIGRSSLSCSFKLNSSNKLISRVHAEIRYEPSSDLVVLKCTGFNGLNITIPRMINVEHIKDREYKILVEGSNEVDISHQFDETDDELTSNVSRVLSRNRLFTNFYMLKDEIIKMPIIEGTVLDFRGDLALLVYDLNTIKHNPKNQELTVPKRKLSISELTKIVEQKRLQFSTHPTLKEIEKKKNGFLSSEPRPIEKKILSNTIIYKRSTPITTPTSSPNGSTTSLDKVVFDINENKENEQNSQDFTVSKNNELSLVRKPLADITHKHNSVLSRPVHDANTNTSVKELTKAKNAKEFKSVIQSTEVRQAEEYMKGKGTSTLPNTELNTDNSSNDTKSHLIEDITSSLVGSQKSVHKNERHSLELKESTENEENKKRGRPKKKKQTEEEILRNMPKETIESILSTVPMLEDISNIVTNHIAYSRVLQTPFSSLRELNSIKKHNLSKTQLRCVLIHNIACIGVIFRQGKDAAGKALDEEYYYIPEKDLDFHRVQLVEELKGSSSHLRSCRKTHKQYFWKKPKI